MKIFLFGNGNIKFADFEEFYCNPLKKFIHKKNIEFIVCDFRGLDTLVMEFLKWESANVTVLHIGVKPRYLPDKFNTKVKQWNIIGHFKDDQSRDRYAIENCTHFIAKDFNSDENRKSGTLKNIEACLSLGKIQITD